MKIKSLHRNAQIEYWKLEAQWAQQLVTFIGFGLVVGAVKAMGDAVFSTGISEGQKTLTGVFMVVCSVFEIFAFIWRQKAIKELNSIFSSSQEEGNSSSLQ